MRYLERALENKKIIWFRESNRYLLVEQPAFHVIKRLVDSETDKQIISWCNDTYNLPLAESRRFVREVKDVLKNQIIQDPNHIYSANNTTFEEIELEFYSQKTYKVADFVFIVNYESQQLEYLIHPRLAHLENEKLKEPNHTFSVFVKNTLYTLNVDNVTIGKWPAEEIHYFTGKFSMELLNRLYNRTELDWIGVFHASALRYQDQCVMFLGDSGSGKSTLAAILMSKGFQLLADDFVPLDAEANVACFPTAVSVKQSALDVLSKIFPELNQAREYYFPALKKTVRYIVPDNTNNCKTVKSPCKALIFVKFSKDSGMSIEKLSGDMAFERLVPDSWLSPHPENAAKFLDWFIDLPCYQLTYSDNEEMVSAITQLLKND